jgi:hypothetical protein
MGFNDMTFRPSFVKIGRLVQKLLKGEQQSQQHKDALNISDLKQTRNIAKKMFNDRYVI